jgi:cellulose binding protein with CBM2 domain/fibronectin type III domain protein
MKVKQTPLPRALRRAALSMAALCLPALFLVALPLAPQAALADTQLATPTGLHALHVADTSADLYWTSDVQALGDTVERLVNGTWQQYATGLRGYLGLTSLTPGATYTFRIYSIPFPDSGFTASAISAPMTFTTLSAPDSVPPAKPSTPTVNSVSTTGASISWQPGTDNVQVTGYDVQELENGSWTTVGSQPSYNFTQSVGGLAPSTSYQLAVVAFDARGNRSQRSDPVTVTTLATTPYPSCQVQLQSFSPNFMAYVTIANTTAAAISNWTLSFDMPATTIPTNEFSSNFTRTATGGTLTPVTWNATIAPGGGIFIGFLGQASPFVLPSSFSFNGRPCTSG